MSFPLRAPLTNAARIFKSSRFHNVGAIVERAREVRAVAAGTRRSSLNLTEALEWLKRAQDATADRGVSRAFGLGWVRYFDTKGWQPSYPETTGYIIPTFFDCATMLEMDELKRRAIEMADWEVAVQLPSGAVMGGTADETPSPAVFNTGQVMLGWTRAFEETGDEKYRNALIRAAEYLVSVQDDDGAWRRGNSRFIRVQATTYNSRVGWALLLAGKLLDEPRYLVAGTRNMVRTIGQQTANGWYADNCLDDSTAPLTHTTVYAMEGLLGGYDLTGDSTYLQSVVLAADHLTTCVDSRGYLPGRTDASWRATVSWSCLTGACQLAGVLLRLARIRKNDADRQTASRLLDFVASTQHCASSNPGLRGGIKGSFPIDGGYGRFEVLSWATKFFVDALLLEQQLAKPANAPAMGRFGAPNASIQMSK